MQWRKSSYSANEGDCVEVAMLPDSSRAIRDSKNPDGPTLQFPADEWRAFLRRVNAGEPGN
jgi:hypothetical protein